MRPYLPAQVLVCTLLANQSGESHSLTAPLMQTLRDWTALMAHEARRLESG